MHFFAEIVVTLLSSMVPLINETPVIGELRKG